MLNQKGVSILQTLLVTSLIGAISYFVAQQNTFLMRLIKGTDLKYEVESLQTRMKRLIKNPYACNATLNGMRGKIDQVFSSGVGGTVPIYSSNSGASGITLYEAKDTETEASALMTLREFRVDKKVEVDEAILRNAGTDAFEWIIRYKKIGKIIGPATSTKRMRILVSKLSSGNYECLGVDGEGNHIKKLQAICSSLNGEYMSDGRCIGVVTYDTLKNFCNSVEGSFDENDMACRGKPGTLELGNFCTNLKGTPADGGRSCENVPYDRLREELCVSLGGTFHLDVSHDRSTGRCEGVAEIYMKQACQGIGGAWDDSGPASGGACVGALDFKFSSLCSSLDGNYVNGKCENPMNLRERFNKLCTSVGGTYDPATEDCLGVDDSLFSSFCSMLGGNYNSSTKGCRGLGQEQIKNFCDSLGGNFSNYSLCNDIYNSFSDSCGVLGGRFNPNSKICEDIDIGMLEIVCNKIDSYTFEDGKCIRKNQNVCGSGQIMIGSSCQSIEQYLAGKYINPNGSGSCGPGSFADSISETFSLGCKESGTLDFLK